MLTIKPPNYHFCPFCGKKLQIRIEENKKRKYCPACNWTYYPHVAASVAAAIIREGKVLMVKRGREPYKNTWMFPAGFIDFGEHPLETLKREIKEETGLKLVRAKLMKVMQSADDPRSPGHFLFFYRVEVEGKKLKTEKAENTEIGWKEIKKPLKIGWQSHKYMFDLLRKNKLVVKSIEDAIYKKPA